MSRTNDAAYRDLDGRRLKARQRGFFARLTPRGLTGRALLIVLAPLLILEAAAALTFLDRYRNNVTRELARDVAGDIAVLVMLAQANDPQRGFWETALGYTPAAATAAATAATEEAPALLTAALSASLATHDLTLHAVRLEADGKRLVATIEAKSGTHFAWSLSARRGYAARSDLFIFWTIVAAALAGGAAVLLLLNQMRPIRRLTRAMERHDADPTAAAAPFVLSGASEIRRAGAAFVRMRQRIARGVRERALILAGVSHDLRAPLTRLRLHLELLEPSDAIDAMRRDIQELQRMLDDYLSFVRGYGEEPLERLRPDAILRHAVAACDRPDAVRIIAANARSVEARPHAFRRALANLLNNACRHATAIEVQAQTHGQQVAFVVDDNGPGIPEDLRAQALAPFERLDAARPPNAPGSGLGLAIARAIAHDHRGDLSLDTAPAGGLRATITIPRRQAKA